jgi:L-fucose isomerase-like protein
MADRKNTFALFFGNRGFFPASLIAEAREELPKILKEWGHDVLMLEQDATRYGAVETPREGEIYANFLRKNQGKFDGVILCLPNFGDETGAVAALKEANVPILIQAYPDELDKMAPELRRDAFCGKISIMDVFCQYGLKFTALKPHVVSPSSERFKVNMDYFDRVCRVVNGMKDMVVGAIGARTTAFKTVRIDEIALQRHRITMETLDLSDVFARIKVVNSGDEDYKAKAEALKEYAPWEGVLLLGELNNRGLPAACEVDVGNAIAMHALNLASGKPATCLDWNNNYGEEDDKCILFHCGPVPRDLMTDRGRITDHGILANAVGEGHSYGCHVGRIAPVDFTFGSMLTDSGILRFYLGRGRFTADKIAAEFFGCAGVAEIEKLQDVLLHVGHNGYRHHVSVTPGLIQAPVHEALERYLGFEVTLPQGE